jgi:hypothetical protein
MEEAHSFGTPVNIYETKRRHITKESSLQHLHFLLSVWKDAANCTYLIACFCVCVCVCDPNKSADLSGCPKLN